MRSVGAIFLLTLRSLMRSRFLLCVTILALAVVAGLPAMVQDDGTVSGRVQVLVRYTLAAVVFLLSVGTLGVAPGLVAGELETKRLQQVLVKPVRFGQIWLGKWLALIAVNAAVLAASVLLAGGLMRWNLRDSRLAPDQRAELDRTVLTSRAVIEPEAEPIPEADLQVRIAAMLHSGELTADTPDQMARRLAARRIRIERDTVQPGGTRTWRFPAAASSRPDLPLMVRVRFITSEYNEQREVEGEWTVGGRGLAPAYRGSPRLRGLLPQEWAVAPAMPLPAGPLDITYRNTGQSPAVTVLFHPDQDVRLLAPADSFGMNLFRAYWLILFKLALLAAVGVTMGALFSTPVAVLAAFFALVLFGFSGYIGWVAETGVFYIPHDQEEVAPGPPGFAIRVLDPALKSAYRGLNRILAPMRQLDPMERVAAGEAIPWPDVGRGLWTLAGLGGGLMAALAIGVFARRETG